MYIKSLLNLLVSMKLKRKKHTLSLTCSLGLGGRPLPAKKGHKQVFY